MKLKNRIIVPIDTRDIDTALRIVNTLGPHVGMFKFGLELLGHFPIKKNSMSF